MLYLGEKCPTTFVAVDFLADFGAVAGADRLSTLAAAVLAHVFVTVRVRVAAFKAEIIPERRMVEMRERGEDNKISISVKKRTSEKTP